mmetsp:Transcript_6959/g.18679  ORF Transcript_6959/g.18679 Transcript_6959/m.18679 type:complete len:81 (-) Transcript_6959:760-1002(-)
MHAASVRAEIRRMLDCRDLGGEDSNWARWRREREKMQALERMVAEEQTRELSDIADFSAHDALSQRSSDDSAWLPERHNG